MSGVPVLLSLIRAELTGAVVGVQGRRCGRQVVWHHTGNPSVTTNQPPQKPVPQLSVSVTYCIFLIFSDHPK